ncbi:MAG: type II toxin-antitoxin system VapC family toxin [Bryobacterales bacterium]|nr:type II toxin-antitoxin system VapC family toxin [Bryobacterales bacterium]
MIVAVADTHTALWYLLQNPSLSVRARRFIDEVASAGNEVAISSISLAEIVYLVEKKRLPASAYHDLRIAVSDPDFVLEQIPFTGEIVDAMRQVTRDQVPDMPDRMIAATALYLGVPLISRDGRITTSSIETIW